MSADILEQMICEIEPDPFQYSTQLINRCSKLFLKSGNNEVH